MFNVFCFSLLKDLLFQNVKEHCRIWKLFFPFDSAKVEIKEMHFKKIVK